MKPAVNRYFIPFILLVFSLILATDSSAPTPVQLQYDEKKFAAPANPADNMLTTEGILLGRLLFYDKILSGNNTQACANCHLQQYAFTDGKNLAVGSKGGITKRNTMSLVNLAWGNNFFWDGRVKNIEALIKHPITDTVEMIQDEKELITELKQHTHYPALFRKAFPHEEISMHTLSKAIAQFLRTIVSDGLTLPDSLNPASYATNGIDTASYSNMLKEKTMRGMYMRFGLMCTPCHSSESFGGTLMANNMIDKNQQQLFKVPSVMNALATAPYMHDARFATPEAVIAHYDQHIDKLHEVNKHLSLQPIPNLITDFDKKHIAEFLALFTDSSVIKNERYGNPFEAKNFNWDSLLIH